MDIEEFRKEIDALDRELVALLSRRAVAAQRIGQLKKSLARCRSMSRGREATIFANVRSANKGPAAGH